MLRVPSVADTAVMFMRSCVPGVAVSMLLRGNWRTTPPHSFLVFVTLSGVKTSGNIPPQNNCQSGPSLAVAVVSAATAMWWSQGRLE
jgi:hypothetical protein